MKVESRWTKRITRTTLGYSSRRKFNLDRTHSLMQFHGTSCRHRVRWLIGIRNSQSLRIQNLKSIKSVKCTIKKKPMTSFAQNQSGTSHWKPSQCPNHYRVCLRRGCASFRSRASPQLGSCRLSPWVKTVVAPGGLTRHEQEIGHAIERLGHYCALFRHSSACRPLFLYTTTDYTHYIPIPIRHSK